MLVGQSSLVTQGGGQQRTITSKQQQSVISAPVAGARPGMQQATVVLPVGKKVPGARGAMTEVSRWQGSITFGGGKKAMPPPVPSHCTWISVGQMICGRQSFAEVGQFATIT